VDRAQPDEVLQVPAAAPGDQLGELVADVARSGGYVQHTRDVASRAGAGDLVVAELADMGERLAALHLVALVAGGWCAGYSCGAELTDPSSSPSGARHCRACRVGWTLAVDDDGRLRAVSRPWPSEGAETAGGWRSTPAGSDRDGG
jgi:hypothetical protein